MFTYVFIYIFDNAIMKPTALYGYLKKLPKYVK